MKFSYQWISELVPGLQAEPVELMRLITMKTAECEGIEEAGDLLREACAARVLSVEPIEGSSHNRKAVVETAKYGTRTVVCGAPNCREGLWTVYAPIGVKTVSGVESDGMLASGKELGLNRDHEGIVELTDAAAFGLKPDWVIEVDNKSLTHRPDLWGHYGMAREVSAITETKLQDPVDLSLLPVGGEPPYKVAIEDFGLSPRFSALLFENVTVQPSPLWLQFRLEAVGLNPINNIVDVTNYLAAELAQPTHAYDADKIAGDTFYVRVARDGEKALALNKETYELDSSNLVIADASGPVGIAGVIGGDASAIGDGTTRIVLEAANFNATSVRKTAAKIKNRTDASMRFEKSQDPENTLRALARGAVLLQMVSPGIRIVGGLIDSYRPLPAVAPIVLDLDWLDKKLGHKASTAQVRGILEGLQFGVEETAPRVFKVTVPSWRATKDISLREDLVEEIGRMIGYGEMTPTAPLVPSVVPPANPTREYHHHLRDLLSAQGYTEAYNYSFLSDETVAEFGFAAADHIRVLNPIASDQALMRLSLVPGIVRNVRENRKYLDTFKLFEIGHEIHKQADGLPVEIPYLAAAMFSKEGDSSALSELKRLADSIVPGCSLVPCSNSRVFEHPARVADVVEKAGGETIGRLFEIHPSFVEAGRAVILELNLQKTEGIARAKAIKYRPLRRFPVSAFDLSVITDLRHYAGNIDAALAEFGGTDLVTIEFQRQYSGPPLEPGRKSVSFRLTVGASGRTLSSDEVTAIRDRIIEGMRSRGYELRV
jgi:phenylalanyl-tRNA synthetase beta chain